MLDVLTSLPLVRSCRVSPLGPAMVVYVDADLDLESRGQISLVATMLLVLEANCAGQTLLIIPILSHFEWQAVASQYEEVLTQTTDNRANLFFHLPKISTNVQYWYLKWFPFLASAPTQFSV